jgi:hypothetical protein
MQEAATKIQRAWKALDMMFFSQKMCVEVLVKAKLIREAYLAKHAIILQHAIRQWLGKETKPIKRFSKAVTKLQSHYRRRRAAVQVDYFRKLVGTRLKRFVHTTAVLCPDAHGLLTRARDILPDDNVAKLPPPLRLMRLVHITALSDAQREELGFAVSPIQALGKFQHRVRRVEDIQRVWRTRLARRELERKRQRVKFIQAVWRAKLARKQLQHARAAAIMIQAHTHRMLGLSARRRQQEELLAEAFAALTDLGDEVVDGRRVRPGGSVSN